MRWKVFAVWAIITFGIGVANGGSTQTAADYLGFLFYAVTLIGLIVYEFKIRRLQTRYWIVIAWLFAAQSVFALGFMLYKVPSLSSPLWALACAFVIAAAYFYYHWLALHRLGLVQLP